MFAHTTIQGRLGEYRLEMTDTEGEHTSPQTIEVARPVKIEWGEQGTDYPEQILKSRMQLEVLEGAAYLRPILSGGFSRRRFEVSVQGPGVDWLGYIEPESRRLPLSTKTRPQSLSLLISDDFARAENVIFGDIVDTTIDGAIDRYLGEDQGETYVRIDGEWEERDTGDRLSTDDIGAGKLRVDVEPEENLYDSLIALLSTTRSRVYRPLSERGIVCHSLRDTGRRLDAYSQKAADLEPLPGSVNEIPPGDLIDEEASVEDVVQAGTIKADLSDHNLAHLGTVRRVSGVSSISRSGPYDSGANYAVSGEVRVKIGFIDPSDDRPLGFFVSAKSTNGNFSAEIIDLESNFTTQTIDFDGTIVPPGVGPFNPEVVIVGSPEDAEVEEMTVELIDEDENIIETLFSEADVEGVEPVEIDRGVPPKSGGTPLAGYFNDDLLIQAEQPFLGRIAIERAYRPAGVQSLQAEVFGLYGPEDALLVEVPATGGGTRVAQFVCGKGRTVNLTAGTTQVSDVELPESVLAEDTPGAGEDYERDFFATSLTVFAGACENGTCETTTESGTRRDRTAEAAAGQDLLVQYELGQITSNTNGTVSITFFDGAGNSLATDIDTFDSSGSNSTKSFTVSAPPGTREIRVGRSLFANSENESANRRCSSDADCSDESGTIKAPITVEAIQ